MKKELPGYNERKAVVLYECALEIASCFNSEAASLAADWIEQSDWGCEDENDRRVRSALIDALRHSAL